MKRAGPIETTFEAAQLLAKRCCLTVSALPVDESPDRRQNIDAVQDRLQAARGGGRRYVIHTLERAEDVAAALADTRTAAYLYGLAVGLALAKGGA
jgi:hypothetical protein